MLRQGVGVSVGVVAEKPSVARDLAAVLGARARGEGVLTGNGYVVTWAIGHLVALAQPHEIHPEWKRWTPEHLPLLPDQWPLVVLPDTRRRSSRPWSGSSATPRSRAWCAPPTPGGRAS